MTEGSFSPLLSSFPLFFLCCSHSQFSFPSPSPDFFTSFLSFSLSPITCLNMQPPPPILNHTLKLFCHLKAEDKPFSPNVCIISFKCFNLVMASHCWNAMTPPLGCSSSLSPLPQCYCEVGFHTCHGWRTELGEPAGRALHNLINGPLLHSSSWAAVCVFFFFVFFKRCLRPSWQVQGYWSVYSICRWPLGTVSLLTSQ